MLAVVERRSNTALVIAASRAAQAAGVRGGMTLSQARAILPSLPSTPLDEHAESHSFEALAAFAYSFSPRVALLRPQTIILDITGCERLHGSEEQLLRRVREGFNRLGYTVCAAVADNATAACALAMGSGVTETIALPASTLAALAELPISALRLNSDVLEDFEILGVRKAGQLLSLPTETLPVRFGEDLVARVRQLRGEATESFEAWRPEQQISERLDFTGPTDRWEALMFALRKACTFLAERLDAAASGARRIEVRLIATEGEPLAFVLDTSRPVADLKGVTTLVTGRFETVDVGDRWYEAIELAVPSREPLAPQQQTLFGERRGAGAGLNELVDELTGRLGSSAVSRAELTDHADPQHSYRYVPFQAPGDRSEQASASRGHVPAKRPARVCFGDYVRVSVDLDELPAYWDWARNCTRLRVVGDIERITLAGPHDYMTIEGPDGAQHFCWYAPGGWWVPPPLEGLANDLRELTACAMRRGQHAGGGSPRYAELVCATNFSFLRGASHARDLVDAAKAAGLHAIAVTDLHTLAGMVRAHAAAKEQEVKLLVGARLHLKDGPELCVYAMNRNGYSRLCRLLTTGKMRAEKGECDLFTDDLKQFREDLQVVLLNGSALAAEKRTELSGIYGDNLSWAIARHLDAGDTRRVAGELDCARQAGIAPVAVNDVHWHDESNKLLQDVQTCIRHGVTRDEGMGRVFPNGERRVKSPSEMAMLFEGYPELLERSVQVSDACTFSLDELRYEYPTEMAPPGMSMQDYLEQETWKGAARRYPEGVPEQVQKQIAKELALIDQLSYAPYFLTVYDISNKATELGIEHQGRGSAANSAVCFCLHVTEVDPAKINLVCERFISSERNEPPDIDVDFEHERREEIIQYIYSKYGRDRAGICATVITYRSRSSVREVGKVMGLSLDQVDRLAKAQMWWDEAGSNDELARQAGVDPADPRVRLALGVASRLRGYPRHLSQHVGGFVITRGRLDELVPIENAAMEDRTVIEWDKNDIDELGILKVDCLSLGMLTAIRKTFHLIESVGGPSLTVKGVRKTDEYGNGQAPEAKAIYAMLQRADTVGTFQVESRAQMSMLPRLKPERFYDLVVEVAIVRPGPIQGGMVHPYLRNREKARECEARGIKFVPQDVHPLLHSVLEHTYGVPLFQEQVMRIAVVAAGFSAGQAELLRRSLGSWGREGEIEAHRTRLLTGMMSNGLTAEFANRIIKQIEGFAAYGFPESHAASFAIITYVSCYLKRFYPAAFTAGLLNSQPMGFYSASSLVSDARKHGVEVRPPCINASSWDCTLENPADGYPHAGFDAPPNEWGLGGPALRLGLRLIVGLGHEATDAIIRERNANGAYAGVHDLVRRVDRLGLGRRKTYVAMSKLAAADALAAFGLSRREALWHMRSLGAGVPDLFKDLDATERAPSLPPLTAVEATSADYRTKQLTLGDHPIALIRAEIADENLVTAEELTVAETGSVVRMAGLVINRQRPQTAKGVVFMTLEDETGTANIIVHPQVFRAYRAVAAGSNRLIVEGTIERNSGVVHVLARTFRSLMQGADLTTQSRDFR